MTLFKKVLAIFFIGILSSSFVCSYAKTKSTGVITGKVIGISDGDTLTVLDANHQQFKVRLAGIDCPESSQAFGNRAKRTLSEKVFSQNVKIETRDKDGFGRTLGIVKIGDEDINEYLILQGVAWHFKKYAHNQPAEEAERYAKAEQIARQNKRGLWIQENPIPPWEFRAQAKHKDKN